MKDSLRTRLVKDPMERILYRLDWSRCYVKDSFNTDSFGQGPHVWKGFFKETIGQGYYVKDSFRSRLVQDPMERIL